MFIYRIIRVREKPAYYQSRKQVLYGTGKRAAAIVRSVRENRRESVTIERAEVGEFTDVTKEFLKGKQ